VNAALAQRQVALVGVALLAVVVALALTSARAADGGTSGLPESVPAHGGGWYSALASTQAEAELARRTACGHILEIGSMGVAHPVLPCGAKVWIGYGEREALTQVIDRGPSVPGREFLLTPALADKLAFRGTQRIRWRFAR
jgi:rare lipoprotein A (peptidoglycan hydrolase)